MTRADDELARGALVDGVFLVEQLHARGGWAAVYRARDLRSAQRVAIKVLRRDLATRTSTLRRFAQEADLLNRLDHPNIVEVLATGELDDGRPYIAMEWLDGRSLQHELAARGPLSLPEATDVIAQIASALAASHALGVVHRDLKAANVIALPAGDWFAVKLVDFGIAKFLRPPPGAAIHHTTSTVLGTPLSMAPEQIRGAAVDARTDVYGLGVLLYQLLTGEPPFLADDVGELEELHLSAPAPRASDRVTVPKAVDEVIARCMEKGPARRYADAEAALAALCAAVDGDPDAAPACWSIALLFEARLTIDDDGEVDDALLDELERSLAIARLVCSARGLAVALETSSSLLAITTTGADPAPELDRVAAIAAELRDRLANGDRRVRLALAIHADTSEDAVLRPSSWPAAARAGAITRVAA